ncbi:MAG: right-handed parallel beta-helix repeat-containing protein [Deltaproteobacteria bacterium]|nr:right-handed parallel beta-helix repeat-containing protein [Deltaproteobacteria bacterium]
MLRWKAVVRGWLLGLAVAALLVGCSDEATTGGDGEGASGGQSTGGAGGGELSGCTPGEHADVDGQCVPAGLAPDLVCPPGEVPLRGGGCEPAGVRPSGCAEGFEHDGTDRCVPVLPAADCDGGTMALPGDATCQPVAECGSAPWGDIPVGPDTVYVDASYAGGEGNGTAAQPFTTIEQALQVAPSGALVAIAAGTYDEAPVITGQPVSLWGRCPDLVTVRAPAGPAATIMVRQSGVELRGLSLTGSSRGVDAADAAGLVLDRLRVHDTPEFGIGLFRVSSAVIRRVLIERTTKAGIYLGGSTATLEDSVVREVAESGGFGVGVSAQAESATERGSELAMRRVVVANTVTYGILATSSRLQLDGVAVRDVSPGDGRGDGLATFTSSITPDVHPDTSVRGSWISGANDYGVVQVAGALSIADTVVEEGQGALSIGMVALQSDDGTELPSLSIRRTTVSGHATGGVGLEGHGNVFGLVVRSCGESSAGFALQSAGAQSSNTPGSLELRHSVLQGNGRLGLSIFGADVTARGVHIADMQADPTGEYGRCVQVRPSYEQGTAASLDAESLLLERCREVAFVNGAADTAVRDSEIRDVAASVSGSAQGAMVRPDDRHPSRLATARFQRTLFDGTREVGISVFSATATIEDCVVRNTAAGDGGLLGDGVAGIAHFEAAPSLTVVHSLVEQSARAGISVFGGALELSDSALICQAFDIDAEPLGGAEASLTDRGGNRCGCPEPSGACASVSANLAPPEPLDP